MRPTNSFATLVFIVVLAIGASLVYAVYGISASWGSNWLIAATLIVAIVVYLATKVADQWDRAVVLRLGRFHVLRGPGL
ncbi:MAG: slipin family protein, partial [Pseudolabrys sp.]